MFKISLLAVFILLCVADIVQTKIGLRMNGQEKNPVARWLFRKVGFVKVSIAKLLVAFGLAVTAYYTPGAKFTVLLFILILPLCISNSFVLVRLYKKQDEGARTI